MHTPHCIKDGNKIDPACGAGATLIAGANTARLKLEKIGLNYQDHIAFVGQDLDTVTGMMCYIQLSLLGCAGYVKIGNTLTEPVINKDNEKQYWYTPMWMSDIWVSRRTMKSIHAIAEGVSK